MRYKFVAHSRGQDQWSPGEGDEVCEKLKSPTAPAWAQGAILAQAAKVYRATPDANFLGFIRVHVCSLASRPLLNIADVFVQGEKKLVITTAVSHESSMQLGT